MITYPQLVKLVLQKIKEKLRQEQRTVAWLARELNLDASNFAKKLNNYNISPEMLIQICVILKENFYLYYYDFVQEKISNGKN